MDDRILTPPSTFTVDHERRATLFQADDRTLVRTAGFVPQGSRMQTTGVFPQLTVPRPGKGGKKSGGKKKGSKSIY